MTIKTYYDNPPIPIRSLDWSAYDDDTYDEEAPTGHGVTEMEAIRDLLNQLEQEKD